MSNIEKLNFSKLDIRMLSALELLLRERSVNVAATYVGLSQPAMSNALSRMRATFEDSLLVRGSKGLILTKRGQQILQQLTEVLPRLEELGRTADFQPGSTRRTFQIAVTDHAAITLLPIILNTFRASAPMATLRAATVQSRHVDMDHLEEAGFDVRIGWFETLPLNWHVRTLFEEHLVLIRRIATRRDRTHSLDLDAFLRLKHVMLASDQPSVHNFAETELAAKGLKRKAGAFVSSYSAMPFIVARSDMIAVLPNGVAAQFAFFPGIQILPSPFPFRRFKMSLAWHARVHHDRANKWLRATVISAAVEAANLSPLTPAHA